MKNFIIETFESILPTAIFMCCYFVINISRLGLQYNPAIMFFTSPFSALEITFMSRTLVQIYTSLFYNFYLVVIYLLSYGYLYAYSRGKLFEFPLPPWLSFSFSVLSSYITSAINWVILGLPSTGTSIIGVTTFTSIIVGLFIPLIKNKVINKFRVFTTVLIIFILLFFLIDMYFVSAMSLSATIVRNHTIGLICYGLLTVLYVKGKIVEKFSRRNN